MKSKLVCASLVFAGLIVQTTAVEPVLGAPTYSNSQVGTFGVDRGWSYNSILITANSFDDAFSARFTAFDTQTVDAVLQRYVGRAADTTIEVGIMADDPLNPGLPSGTYLTSTTFTGIGDTVSAVSFNEVTLTAGNVYHVVSRLAAGSTGQFFRIYGGASGSAKPHRPYDRAVDPMANAVNRNNGGAWTPNANEPFFALANDGTYIGGPGQTYNQQQTGRFKTRGGTGFSYGQWFKITDKEVPVGAQVKVTEIPFRAAAVGTPLEDLIIRFREADGTILGTTTMTPAQANGTDQTLALDVPVYLDQGTSYLLTTEIVGGTTTQGYDIDAMQSAYAKETNWGGTTWAYGVRTNNDWSTLGSIVDSDMDMAVTFNGLVIVPEPSLAALTLAGGLVLAGRRRRPAPRAGRAME